MFKIIALSPKKSWLHSFLISASWGVLGGVIILLVMLFTPFFFRYEEQINLGLSILLFILLLLTVFRAIHYIFFKDRKGKQEGYLILETEQIKANQEVIPIQQIAKIRFIGNDIKGDFRGFVTKGIENQCRVNLRNGESRHYFFEQTAENTLAQRKSVLNHYLQLGLLSESNYESILNNTNYY